MQGWDLTGPGLLPLQHLPNLTSLSISRSPMLATKHLLSLLQLSASLKHVTLDSVAVAEPRDGDAIANQQHRQGLRDRSGEFPVQAMPRCVADDGRMKYSREALEVFRLSPLALGQEVTTLLRAEDVEGLSLFVGGGVQVKHV